MKTTDPTPSQIAMACRMIRSTWSDEERARRERIATRRQQSLVAQVTRPQLQHAG